MELQELIDRIERWKLRKETDDGPYSGTANHVAAAGRAAGIFGAGMSTDDHAEALEDAADESTEDETIEEAAAENGEESLIDEDELLEEEEVDTDYDIETEEAAAEKELS